MREFFEIVAIIIAIYEWNRITSELAAAKKAISRLQDRVYQLSMGTAPRDGDF
ncbi:hypothetical protein PQQ63_15220 [Paraburkholderia metrosideri]|uniref:Uncharacterized protein n=1 Tax=Paraburkholderia metrosideri TaxID=580937 RepID=A0ABW9DTA3_9BURK